jgi:AcrR family transcriptional regulator
VISQSTTDKQAEILKAALKLFVSYGFHGTPTSMIAKEAGVANGTLFHYYSTKDELIVALYVSVKTQMTDCMMPADNKNEPLVEICRRFYTNALNWGLNNNTEFRFLQQFSSSPYTAMIPEAMQQQGHAWVSVILLGIERKEIKAMPAEYITSILSSHLFGVSQYIMNTEMTTTERKKLIDESFDMVWKMISI